MTDTQLVTLSVAFLAAVIAVLFNNSRITDLRDSVSQRLGDVNRRFDDVNSEMNRRFDEMNAEMNRRFDEMNRHIDDKFNLLAERLQRMEDNIMRILADHESRISKLEGK